ncbi:MAG: hypothetical protein AAGF15_06380 [Pseudomonadota bacterium]
MSVGEPVPSAFEDIQTNCRFQLVFDGPPVRSSQSLWSNQLAFITMRQGDVELIESSNSGRTLRIASQGSSRALCHGIATHIALASSLDGALLLVTSCADKVLVEGCEVALSPWHIEAG